LEGCKALLVVKDNDLEDANTEKDSLRDTVAAHVELIRDLDVALTAKYTEKAALEMELADMNLELDQEKKKAAEWKSEAEHLDHLLLEKD
jgi:hypothetical protein